MLHFRSRHVELHRCLFAAECTVLIKTLCELVLIVGSVCFINCIQISLKESLWIMQRT